MFAFVSPVQSPGKVPLNASLLLLLLLRIIAEDPSFVVAFFLWMCHLCVESSGGGPCWFPPGFPPRLTRHSLRLNAECGDVCLCLVVCVWKCVFGLNLDFSEPMWSLFVCDL